MDADGGAARGAERGTPARFGVEVVSVWSYPPLSAEERLLTTASAVEAETIERVGETVDRLRHEGHNSELTIKVDVRQGAPGKVLIDLAVGCELLVVGRRDRSRLRHLVLGSVADQCVRHSPVPVMVVPSDWERPDRSGDVTLAVGMDFSDSANEALRWTLGERPSGATLRCGWCTPGRSRCSSAAI
ncbi:universal stress protein [Candidatus Microthrix sp.]|uniref:universal stress protein n=1 Tax=Candidatus Neomicrothrix sp. TaxID=2719034 RepID=UPI0025C1B8C8|nr:universal stress protein [Candidatus Microthrix sp.]